MSPLWLILIVPASVLFGLFAAGLCHAASDNMIEDAITSHLMDEVRKGKGGL